ncbi:MAG: 16S rRNA (guanine(966)-N(2))-methyltransferase RsmD, partial [Lachnospiraceae bacterium]
TDRIKETLFNMLNPILPGCCFLDLFAGSGQIGLEAVSRGANKAVFVEQNRKAALCIEENIKFTKFTEECKLLNMDAIAGIRRLDGTQVFDVVFMDPPYAQEMEQDVLKALADSSLITRDTLLVIETALSTDFSYLEELGYLITKEKKYKTNMHVFIKLVS